MGNEPAHTVTRYDQELDRLRGWWPAWVVWWNARRRRPLLRGGSG